MTRTSKVTSASSRTFSAASIAAASDFDPMMIPTRGASTGICSISGAVSATVSGASPVRRLLAHVRPTARSAMSRRS